MGIIIGGTSSGTGKTSVSLAIAAGLKDKSLNVTGFKAGPDYLDPMYMELVSRHPCFNLDPWMSSQDHVLELVSQTSGLALVEGVMGFYDGAQAISSLGSTAHLTSILNLPALLVTPAKAMARSFAALIHGFVSYENEGRNIKGIIANNCGSPRHADILARALESSGLPPLAGAVPDKAFPELSSRHLGLEVPDSLDFKQKITQPFAAAASKYLDMGFIQNLVNTPGQSPKIVPSLSIHESRVRIGIARDNAFNFYYQANLEALQQAGAELVYFSPIRDKNIPDNTGLLYFGGGYPELFAYELSQNSSMRKSITRYIKSGGQIYAECGGLVYLCSDLKTLNGQIFPMVGALPFRSKMLTKRQSLGYVEVTFTSDCILGEQGQSIRGHEYHYSDIEPGSGSNGWENIYSVFNARGEAKNTLGIKKDNILASYAHVYFGHRPDVARRIVAMAESGLF